MTNNPLVTPTTEQVNRPLPLNVQVAQAMNWQVVNLSPETLPYFVRPDGETMLFDEWNPDADPKDWYEVERWMVEHFSDAAGAVYILKIKEELGVFTFRAVTAPFKTRCEAFVWAVKNAM